MNTAYYLRINAVDEAGVLSRITQILSDGNINVEAITQKEAPEGQQEVPLIILTNVALEKDLDAAVEKIEALATTHGSIMRIRVEQLG